MDGKHDHGIACLHIRAHRRRASGAEHIAHPAAEGRGSRRRNCGARHRNACAVVYRSRRHDIACDAEVEAQVQRLFAAFDDGSGAPDVVFLRLAAFLSTSWRLHLTPGSVPQSRVRPPCVVRICSDDTRATSIRITSPGRAGWRSLCTPSSSPPTRTQASAISARNRCTSRSTNPRTFADACRPSRCMTWIGSGGGS